MSAIYYAVTFSVGLAVSFQAPVPLPQKQEIGRDAFEFSAPGGGEAGLLKLRVVLYLLPEGAPEDLGGEDGMRQYAATTYMGAAGGPASQTVTHAFGGGAVKGARHAVKIPSESVLESYVVSLPKSGRHLFVGFQFFKTASPTGPGDMDLFGREFFRTLAEAE